jgi:hypothetical protein
MRNRFYIFLTYLVIISIAVLGISMSRYETTMTGSSGVVVGRPVIDYVPVSATLDGAPVSVSSGGININEMTAGSELIYKFNINNFKDGNRNEVLMKYKVSISFAPDPRTIPLTYTLTPDAAYQSAGDGWILMGFDSEETHSYTLNIVWDGADMDPAYLNQQQKVQLRISAQQTLN